METERIRASLSQVWLSTHSIVLGRVETIERVIDALDGEAASPHEIEQAAVEAHKLAGVLGTFGLERGSALAGEIEAGLDAADLSLEGLRYLATELHAVVANAQMEE